MAFNAKKLFEYNFKIIKNIYQKDEDNNTEKNKDLTQTNQTSDMVYDLKVAVCGNSISPYHVPDIYIYIMCNSKWCYQSVKSNDFHLTSLLMYKKEVLKILSTFQSINPCKIGCNDLYKLGHLYVLEKNDKSYQAFIKQYFNEYSLRFQTSFTEDTLEEALLEAEIDFKISNIENCYSVQKQFTIDDYYTKFNYGYTPPEYDKNKRICFKSDIYRLGVLAYELFYGKKYFGSCEKGEFDKDQNLQNLKLRSLKSVNYDKDNSGFNFIFKCLISDPDLRPTALELLNHPFLNSEISTEEVEQMKEDFYTNLKKFNA